MRKVLNWGVVPLNLKWQGMVVHGLCWARINSPENIRRFNSSAKTSRSYRVRLLILKLMRDLCILVDVAALRGVQTS